MNNKADFSSNQKAMAQRKTDATPGQVLDELNCFPTSQIQPETVLKTDEQVFPTHALDQKTVEC